LQTQGEAWANRTVYPTLGVAGLSVLLAEPQGVATVLSSNFSEVMRIVTPLGMMNYLRLAAKQGLLIKDGRSLELLQQVDFKLKT